MSCDLDRARTMLGRRWAPVKASLAMTVQNDIGARADLPMKVQRCMCHFRKGEQAFGAPHNGRQNAAKVAGFVSQMNVRNVGDPGQLLCVPHIPALRVSKRVRRTADVPLRAIPKSMLRLSRPPESMMPTRPGPAVTRSVSARELSGKAFNERFE